MALTERQIDIMRWLQDNHFGKWLDTRQKNELRMSDEQHVFCCCGKIASALHENCCRRFQEKVNKATIKELEPLYKAEQKDVK